MISSAAERPGSLSVPAGEERAAPDGGEVGARAGRELVRKPAHGSAALVEQAGLPGERLTALDHADGVVAAGAGAGALHVHDLGAHAVDLDEVARDAAGEGLGVELGLDRHAVRDRVQAPEKRSSEVSSATRTVGRGSRTAISSAFTSAVSATGLLRGSFGTTVHATAGPAGDLSLASEIAMLDANGHAGDRREPLRELAATIATERCLPPVQPMATTEWLLFSR